MINILFSITLLLCLVCLLQTLRLRSLGVIARRQKEAKTDAAAADVSIIVTCQEQQSELKRLLPLLLSQHYGGEYEVIVVDKQGDKDTIEWLEWMEEQHPHLSHTFCPPTARDISIQRLALSLGAKAANYEWLVFLSVEAQPTGDNWLSQLTAFCNDEADAVLGISSYEGGRGWYGAKVRMVRTWEQLSWLPYALRHAPFLTHPELVCYRRSHFLAHQGFASSGLLAGGAVELLVNHNVRKGRCHVNLLPGAAVKLPLPTPYIWKREQLYNVETHHHLRHSFLPKLVNVLCLLPFPLYTLLTASFFFLSEEEETLVEESILQAVAGSAWLLVCLMQYLMLRNTWKALNPPSEGFRGKCPAFLLPPLMLWLPLNRLMTFLRWRFTKKEIFRKKFFASPHPQ